MSDAKEPDLVDPYSDHVDELTASATDGHSIRLLQPLRFGGVAMSLACTCQKSFGAVCPVIRDRLVSLGVHRLNAIVGATWSYSTEESHG